MPVSFLSSNRSADERVTAIDMVDECLVAAISYGASDVHFQPRADRWEVSFRIDGVLQPIRRFERCRESDPVSRLMALAGLPSYRGGIPQEGLLRWKDADNEEHEMRLGIFPTVHGNRAAIRMMDGCESVRRLDQLGFDDCTRKKLKWICDARDGLLLVAGPAGSGKTTTLYGCLTEIAASEFHRSVLTIEDPIESVIDSISQSQLQSSSGMTLATAMRSAVRQDAEVLLVSEIRDSDTAEAVLAASMTGSLCFSSVHAGSIGGTLRRLVQMKLPIFAIQSGLRGVLCQRLLRRVCQQCSEKDNSIPTDCEHCHGSGYCGRIPISQMVTFDDGADGQAVFDALNDGQSASAIDRMITDAGISGLQAQATKLVEQGISDCAEVFRVLGRASGGGE